MPKKKGSLIDKYNLYKHSSTDKSVERHLKEAQLIDSELLDRVIGLTKIHYKKATMHHHFHNSN
jgi:hypothetical protein